MENESITALSGQGATAVPGTDESEGGLLHLASSMGSQQAITVDRENGVIRNVSAMTIGPAAGHGFHIDEKTLSMMLDLAQQQPDGIPMRFTHPELDNTKSKDGIELSVGRFINPRIEGESLRGDVQLRKYARSSPSGNLWDYLLDMAEEAPQDAGLSAVAAFAYAPSQLNGQEIRAARPRFFKAVDFVGTPAANRQGLLSTPNNYTGDRNTTMNKRLKQYLRSLGLKNDATDAQAQAFMTKLSGKEKEAATALSSLAVLPDDATDEQKTAAKAKEKEVDTQLTAIGLDPKNPTKALATNDNNDPDREDSQSQNGGTVTLSQADIDRARQEATAQAIASERQRQSQVRALASQHNLSQEWVDRQLESSHDMTAIRLNALEALSQNHQPIQGLGGSSVRVTRDRNIDTLAQAVEDAILLRANMAIPTTDSDDLVVMSEGNVVTRDAHDRAREFRGLTLHEMARKYLQAVGVPTDGMTRQQVCRLSFNRDAMLRHTGDVFLSHSTSDFPYLLSNVIGKTLRQAYMRTPVTYPLFTRRKTAPDFNIITRTQRGEFAGMAEVKEGGEYAEISIGEAKETYNLAKYGHIFTITWELLVNDKLDAFTQIPSDQGVAAKAKEEVLVYNILTSNPTMGDNNALFSSAHGNLAAGTGNVGAPSTTLLNNAYTAFQTRTGLTQNTEEPVFITAIPRFLLHPPQMRGTVLELLHSQVKPGANNSTTNIWQNGLDPIPNPLLGQNSTTAWYVTASPDTIDTIEACFLEGEEQPMLEQQDGFRVDGREHKVRHVFAAKAIDWRGLYKNPGA